MIPKDIAQLISDYATARSLYANEWLKQYNMGMKNKACDMATDATPTGIAYHIIKKQIEYLITRGHEVSTEDIPQD